MDTELKPRYSIAMVVDDNEIDRYVAENVIARNRFASDVVSAESAMDALSYLEQHQSDPQALPQVIFLDINMPEMNGFDFLEKYELLTDDIKNNCVIVILSTSLDVDDKEMATRNKHVSMFLNKPLNQEKLRMLSNLRGGMAEN